MPPPHTHTVIFMSSDSRRRLASHLCGRERVQGACQAPGFALGRGPAARTGAGAGPRGPWTPSHLRTLRPRLGRAGPAPHGHGGGRPARRAVHLRRQDSGPRCQGPSTTGLHFSATHNVAPSEGSGVPPRSTGKGRWQAPLPIGTPASRHAHGPAPNTRVRPERNAQCNPLFLTKNEQTKTLTFPRT